jgi:hypothetical protein
LVIRLEDSVLEAGRAIRWYLPSLVGEEAPQLDREIADLLNAARRGEDVADQVVDLLAARTATHVWAAQLLGDPGLRPPEVRGLQDRGFQGLAGEPGIVDAMKYICPEGDYVWYRLSVGDPVEECPTHGRIMIPA